METPKQPPLSLQIVAILFLLGGVLAVLEILVSLVHSRISINFGVLGIFICFGLLRFSRGWRTCALVFIWLSLIFLPIFAWLLLNGSGQTHFRILGQRVAKAPGSMAFAFTAGAFVLALWQHYVLTRQDVVQLFYDAEQPIEGEKN